MRSMVPTSPEKGADTLACFASTTPGADWISGGYYVKCKPSTRLNALANHGNLARGLWETSERLVHRPDTPL
jgi:hypothetical protein